MGSPVRITRTDQTAPELRTLAASSSNAAQARRLPARRFVQDGTTWANAARVAGMDRQTLRDWVHRYNEAGLQGLMSRVPPAPNPN